MSEKKPRRPKGEGVFFRRPNGLYVRRIELPRDLNGKRRYREVSSMDRNEVIDKFKKLRREIEDGRLAVTGNTTIGKWLDRWLDEIHGPKVRPTTRRDYEMTIRLHIKPHIGDKRLDKLTPQHVRQLHDAIDSDRTAQKAHIVLQRALRDAVREGMLARNVAELADKPRYTANQREPLDADQAKALLRVAIDQQDPLATRWAAALFLGARQGELLGLQWDRVDLTAGLVDFAWQLQALHQEHGCGERHSDGTHPCGRVRPGWCPQRHWDLPRGFPYKIVHRSLALTPPKTRAGARVVPIPTPLWAMLERHPRGDRNPHGLVWHHDDGRPISPREDHTAWKAALTAAGLPEAPLHVARHTTATLLMQAGVPEQVRMAILGHVSISATRGYAHVNKALERQAMTALDSLLELD